MAVARDGDWHSPGHVYLHELLRLCGCVPTAGCHEITMQVSDDVESFDTLTVTLGIPDGAFYKAAHAVAEKRIESECSLKR